MGWFDKVLSQRAPALGRSAVTQALADIATHHELEGDKNKVTGDILGFEVTIEREIVEVTGDASQLAERLLLRVALPRPVDLGLRVTFMAESDPRRPFPTGDATFDQRFVCVADEAERGRVMLSETVRALLLEGPETEVGDGGVTVAIGQADAHRLGEALGYTLDLARALDEARLGVRLAAGLREYATEWSALAAEQALVYESTPLSVSGQIYGIAGEVRAVRDGFAQYHFALRATFARPLYVGLLLHPHSQSHQYGRDADPLGDAAFDRVFVATSKGAPVLTLFDADVRARLLALRDAGLQIRADDRGLTAWLGMKKEDLGAAVQLLAPLCDVAAVMAMRIEITEPA